MDGSQRHGLIEEVELIVNSIRLTICFVMLIQSSGNWSESETKARDNTTR